MNDAVTNGVTVEDAVHFNQYKDTFSNVFGVTDTAATRVTRLALPESTSAPGSPVTSQLYVETDLGSEGSGGRLFMRHAKNGAGAATWVPYLPYRQYAEGAMTHNALAAMTTSYADIPGCSVTITPTGGRLFIYLIASGAHSGGGDAAYAFVNTNYSLGSSAGFSFRPVVGGQNLVNTFQQVGNVDGGGVNNLVTVSFPSPGLLATYLPVGGSSIIVKVQAQAAAASLLSAGIYNMKLVVIEAGDG